MFFLCNFGMWKTMRTAVVKTKARLRKLFPIIISVPPFSGVADGKGNIVGTFGFPIQGGVLKHVFNSLRAVSTQPEPHALAEAKVFPAFVLPAVSVIVHAPQFGIVVKGFLYKNIKR